MIFFNELTPQHTIYVVQNWRLIISAWLSSDKEGLTSTLEFTLAQAYYSCSVFSVVFLQPIKKCGDCILVRPVNIICF